jgi:hypothetical protein
MSRGLTNLAYLAIAFAARLATESTANANFFAGPGLCFTCARSHNSGDRTFLAIFDA